MSMDWRNQINALSACLNNLEVTDANKRLIDPNLAFLQLEKRTQLTRDNNTIYFAGNGASAAMASHFAADFAKNGKVKTHVFTDNALITALANDIAYDQVFSEPIRWWLKENDMFVGISSSGNSPNVVNAAVEAKKKGGCVVTLSSMKSDNALRQLGDFNFYIPGKTYGESETGHNVILHYWVDLLVNELILAQYEMQVC